MLGGMDPKQMQRMMKQMGINSEDISADRVIIERGDEKIIIEPPQVVKITMQGQASFQISGPVRTEQSMNEDDIKMVMEKAGVSREKATEALKKSGGDIADAILQLTGGES